MFLKSSLHLGFISRFKHRMKQKENLLANLLHIIAPLSVIKVPKYTSILRGESYPEIRLYSRFASKLHSGGQGETKRDFSGSR